MVLLSLGNFAKVEAFAALCVGGSRVERESVPIAHDSE